MGSLFIGQQFMQNVLGYSTFDAGLAILPAAVCMVLVAAPSARLVHAYGSRFTLLLGYLFVLLSFLTMLLLWTNGSPYWQVGLGYALLGIGVGLFGTPASRSLTASVPVSRVGMASGTADLQRDLGGAIMQSIFGALLTNRNLDQLGRRAARRRIGRSRRAGRLGGDRRRAVSRPLTARRPSPTSTRSTPARSPPAPRPRSCRAPTGPTPPAPSPPSSASPWCSSCSPRKTKNSGCSASTGPPTPGRQKPSPRRSPTEGPEQEMETGELPRESAGRLFRARTYPSGSLWFYPLTGAILGPVPAPAERTAPLVRQR